MDKIFHEIGNYGLVPVIKLNDPDKAVPLAKALCDGGLPVAEVTFRTKCAAEAISRITAEFPDMLVGAGTVCSIEQAQAAVDANAKFIVSPGLNPSVVSWCLKNDIPVAPGIMTPSDLELALAYNLDFVKFFPAEAAGGISSLKAMSAPYGSMKFMPTGGINLDNMHQYLSNSKILAIGGSFMAKESDIENSNWDKITSDTKAAILRMFNFKLEKICLTAKEKEAANLGASMLGAIFGFDFRPDGDVIHCTDSFDFTYSEKETTPKIVMSCQCFSRALEYFKRNSIKISEALSTKNPEGNITEAVLEQQLLGFRIAVVGR